MRKGGPSPHLVAAMASSMVLLVGVAMVAYFVEVRGVGVRAELQSTRALELEILGGALVAVAILTQLCVARIVGSARGNGNERQLLRKALETDYADPAALSQFTTVPELRDLVGMLMAEKTQGRELGDRIETLRGEIDNLAEGMRRSSQDLGRMRQENLSPLGSQVAALWNGLVERVRDAESAAEDVVVGKPATPDASESGVATLVARLDELEAELDLLRSAVAHPVAPNRERMVETVAETQPLLGATSGTAAAAVDPWKMRPAATTPVVADADWGAVTPVEPLHRAATWNAPVVSAAGRESFFTESPATPPAEAFRESPDPVRHEPVQAEPGGWSTAGRASAPASGTPGSPDFEDIDFPHFVGKPVRSASDRVEVTYEAQANEEVVELPASALLFEPEAEESQKEDGVLDLRSLGALEFDR